MEKEFLRICKENNVIGATCIVTKDNEIKEVINYGYSNREKGIKINENVVFRIASVSKLLVATCIMQLVEKGKLDLDEDVSKYLGFKLRNPKYPDKVIDLKMIMTQTSSISDGQEAGVNSDKDSGYNSLNGTKEDVCIEDMLIPGRKYFVPETFNDYEPGTHYEYSNFGCGILACILERVEKTYFFDYFKENIASRLGIKASFVAYDMDCDNIACTYLGNGDLYRSNEKFYHSSVRKRELGNNFVGPAGGLYISLSDLNKVMNCYLNDGLNLLKKETMDRMLQLTWYGDKTGSYTAKGLQFQILDSFEHGRLYGHFGHAYHVRSFLFFNPIQKLGMVCFLNGANYQLLDSGITNVQEAMIRTILDEYWDDTIKMNLAFEFNGKIADLNGRKIEIKYDKDYNSGRHLSMLTLLDIFSISTLQGKTKLDSLLKEKTFLDATNLEWMNYIYNLVINEKYRDDKYEMKKMKQTYLFEYCKKKEYSKKNSKLIANYHTHCNYCNHAVGDLNDYIDEAYRLGFEEIGMSDHGPIPGEFINNDLLIENKYIAGQMTLDDFENKYLTDLEVAKNKYIGKMNVLKGIEIEYFRGHDEYYKCLKDNLDYMILGQHYMMLNGKCLDSYYHMNYQNILEYSKCVVAGIESKLFEILAHPDVFMYHYISENNKLREFDTNAVKASRAIIEACIKNNVILEFNLGGLHKGLRSCENTDIDYLYTTRKFWKLVSEYKDAKVIIGCDAHAKEFLSSSEIIKAKQILEDLNINYINKIRK